jgi:hypothetical protein
VSIDASSGAVGVATKIRDKNNTAKVRKKLFALSIIYHGRNLDLHKNHFTFFSIKILPSYL